MNDIFLNSLFFGAHVKFSGNLNETIQTGINAGMTALQFFLGNPYNYKRAVITKEDFLQTEKILRLYPTRIFSHFCLNSNLAGKKDQSVQTALLAGLQYELNTLAPFSGAVVIHPGTHIDEKAGLTQIADSINLLNFQKQAMLLLENSAGQGSSLATTLNQLKIILDLIQPEKRQHIGLCLDTCHTFAYGDYDLSKTAEIDRWWQDIDDLIGLDKLKLIHLNDSIHNLGKRVDRHAPLGKGKIWEKSFDSLVNLLTKCKQAGIALVLETDEILDMAVVGKLTLYL